MKMFNINNIEIVKCCQQKFCFSLPSVTLPRRTEFFKAKFVSVRIFLSKDSCVCKLLYFVTLLPAIDVYVLTRVSIRVSNCMCVRTTVFHRLLVKLHILVKLLYINCPTTSIMNKDVYIKFHRHIPNVRVYVSFGYFLHIVRYSRLDSELSMKQHIRKVAATCFSISVVCDRFVVVSDKN